jgi:predicted PurR-regulated permease PerM
MQAPQPATVTTVPDGRRWVPRRVILATLTVVGVLVGFYLLYRFSNVLFIVFIAAVLATAMRPAVLWLERHRIPQWAGVSLIYLVLAAAVVGFVVAMVPLLAEQGSALVQEVPTYYQDFRGQLVESNSQLLRRLGQSLPEQLDASAFGGQAQDTLGGQATDPQDTSEPQSIVGQAFGYVRTLTWNIASILATLLIAFFWTLDRDQIIRSSLLIVPVDRRDEARELWETVEHKVGGYVRGQGLLMLTVGVVSAVVFLIIGAPSALLMGVIAGLLEAVQIVGPILSAVVAVVITLASAPEKIIWIIVACLVIQQLENAVLVPRIMGHAVGVNPLVTLLAIAAFGSLLGLLGAILAIPLAAIIQVLLDYWVLNRDAQPAVQIEGRDKTAVVRYLAQDLAQDIRDRIRAKPADQDQDDDSFEEEMEILVGNIDEMLERLAKPLDSPVVSGS